MGLVVGNLEHATPSEPRAFLLDKTGIKVHSWEDPTSLYWKRAELQPNGDLLVVGKDEGDSSILWRGPGPVHHDLDVSSTGEILALGLELRQVEDVRIVDHTLLLLSSAGAVRRKLSIFELLSSKPEIYRLPLETDHPAAIKDSGRVDLLHVNSCAWMPYASLEPRGKLYRSSCVLLSVRHQNLVAIVDLDREQLLWTWGPGELQYPHEATWLENGNVLMFDNGTDERGYSRILEVDPRTDRIAWEYRGDPPERFYSRVRGTAQGLPGGHVLVASSNQGEIVWRYVVRDESGRRLAIRALHYPESLVAPLLSPGDSGSSEAR